MSYDITINGASDDLIEIGGGAPGCDEYNRDDGHFLVICANHDEACIRVTFQQNGTWAVAVAPAAETIPMPKVTMRSDRYTAVAEINDVRMVVPLDTAAEDEDVEPSDDQIYNGFGMEGGIAYSTDPGRDAHSMRHNPEGY